MAGAKQIIVIDDDTEVLTVLCENLKECGFEVSRAVNGNDGLAAIEAGGPPDLIITDIIMPEKEGLETIVEMKKKYPALKIIAISGGGRTHRTDILEMALKLGSDAAFSKPVDMDALETAVRKLVG